MSRTTNNSSEIHKKLVIVGDRCCDKASLLFAFKDDRFIPDYDATIFDIYVAGIKVDEKMIDLALFDTTGEEEYDCLRPLSYPDTNIVLICFSVDSPASATNVLIRWIPEIRDYCDRCPVILVACKTDLRTDPKTIQRLKKEGEIPVTNQAGKKLAARIKADAYMECSAKTREGVQELFLQAARLSLKKIPKKKKRRNLFLRCIQ